MGPYLLTNQKTTALVSGEVVAVVKDPKFGTYAKVKVVHAFTGPDLLPGTVFEVPTADEGDAGTFTIPLLEVGEKGIWRMSTNGINQQWLWYTSARMTRTKDYGNRVEWAETVERLAKLKPVARLELARELAAHKNLKVAELGLEMLLAASAEDAKAAGTDRFLQMIAANKEVACEPLLWLDGLRLRSKQQKEWVGSEERKALMSRFTDEILTDEEGKQVARHLSDTWWLNVLTLPDIIPHLTKIATNAKQSTYVRATAVERVVYAANAWSDPGNAAAFEFFVALLKRDADLAVRYAAARGLSNLSHPPMPPQKPKASFSEAQLRVLGDLLKDEKEVGVAQIIRDAINKAK
jgi:hypothetical protein